MKTIIPEKLKKGDGIRIIAPSDSLGAVRNVAGDALKISDQRLAEELGLKITFGKHAEETDEFDSSSVESRVADLHDAFADPKVKAVFAAIGGFNCNQMLQCIDWDLIRNNPKILIGYSDTTALQNAFLEKAGLVTYSGPAYLTFGQEKHFEYTMDYLKKCLFEEGQIEIKPSPDWSDDATWYKEQENRNIEKNDGWLVINEGKAEGRILGGNLCTFGLLQGTEYYPDLEGSIVFIEDDDDLLAWHADRFLQSLIHQTGFSGVKGIIIGRFQKTSKIPNDQLIKIIKTKKELDNIPVLANLDFGHTFPMFTYPIGGSVEMVADKNSSKLIITQH